MNFIKTKFKDLIVFKGKRFLDSRGYFREILKAKVLPKKKMIFWCLSKSKKKRIERVAFAEKKINKKNLFL
jgi:dTDP-4-dehydrorhamnose 3,5-epimerase-like enzyme